MAPADLTGLVIDRVDDAFTPDTIIGSRPSIESVGRLGKIDAPAGMGVDNKQSVLRIETGGTVVSHTGLVRGNQPSIRRRVFCRIRNRPTLLIDSEGPVHGPERSGQKILPTGAVENKEVAVARSLHQHF